MMGYGYNANYDSGAGMMDGAGALGDIMLIVVIADLVLLGIYLWKKIR